MLQNHFQYDAFISHAVEDKIPIANELCAKLENAGLKIWYSGKELGVGDSIEKTIQKGLNCSRYGIVIFSPTYLAKNWTIREFYTLLAKEIEEHKVILPVLYNVTLDDLKNKDLLMADRFAVNAEKGLDFVVQKLVQEIKKNRALKEEPAWFSKLWFILILSLLANVGFLIKGNVFLPSDTQNHKAFQSFRTPINARSDFPINESFFEELSGMFTQLSTCSCAHPQEDAPDPGNQTAFSYEGKVYLTRRSGNPAQQAQDLTEAHVHSMPRKMTMAVVFQMETGAQSQSEIQEDPDNWLKIVSPSGSSPFMTSGMSKKVDQSNLSCLHPSHTLE